MKKVSTDQPLKEVLAMVTGAVVLHLVFNWNWLLYVAAVAGVASILSGRAARWIAAAWEKTGYILGLIVPKIVLALVYYLVLLPISAFSNKAKKTYFSSEFTGTTFKDVDKEYTPEIFEKTW